MNCDDAIQILLEENHRQRHDALRHVTGDQNCLQRFDQLARAILSDIEYELSCAEARENLANYYEWEHHQGAEFPLLLDLRNHLGRCPYCQEEYQLLEASMAMLADAPLVSDERPRNFNLSFITAPLPAITPMSAIWQTSAQIRRLFQQLQVTISETAASIATLTPQLAPLPYATAQRAGDDPQFSVLILPDLAANIHLKLETRPSRDGTAEISLYIFDSNGDKPIADARVTLRTGEGSLIASSLTGAQGNIQFPRIQAGKYLIQAQYQNQTWEVPISIVRSQSPTQQKPRVL